MKYTVEVNAEGTFWYKEGTYLLHREGGPAIEYADGSKEWYINGQRHREDGPAREWGNGNKEWYINGQRHRLDGPAIERANGDKAWYYQGQFVKCKSQEAFENWLKVNRLTADSKLSST